MAIIVGRQDVRYDTLKKGHNVRWPSSDAEAVSRIELCESPDDAAEALQRIVSAGLRPTVRSGGHCYEDFVANNPGGVILDLSMLTQSNAAGSGAPYRIGTGTQIWNGYVNLYKRYGVTIPGGTCSAVAAGGHISGGGYGLLSRLHGVTVDWLSAVDILTVDGRGRVVARRIDRAHDPDLFRACRGGGGGNFGVITSYTFDKLPAAPREVMVANISFPWVDMTPEKFTKILTAFGEYWETRGKNPDTWGMFAVLVVSHQSGGRFGMSVQFCNPDGTCRDLTVLNEFLDRFLVCKPVADVPNTASSFGSPARPDGGQTVCSGAHTMRRLDWLNATEMNAGGGGSTRAKYKSTYMKSNFTERETLCIYKHMTRSLPNVDLRGSVVAIDSYGGAINRKEMIGATAVHQRSSVMKLQYQTYWSEEKDDAGRLMWIGDFYREMYTGPEVDARYSGTPYPGERYEGCYINYPDKDMLAYSFWPQLYYGDKGLYPFLQEVKRRYDPNNVFHHAMSIRPLV
jgi:FAD/FMN-containing dehydrogenase